MKWLASLNEDTDTILETRGGVVGGDRIYGHLANSLACDLPTCHFYVYCSILNHSTTLSQDIHKDLEEKLARFHNRDDAILYASCFDANAGIFEALLTPEDAVISDELNHASIIDGIRLCKAERHRYKHMDVDDLESILKKTQGCRMRLIVTDGVFSMDGDITPLRELVSLANTYKALLFVDDCHGTGLLGETGRGTEEHLGLDGCSDIINSTLGKALGGAAGKIHNFNLPHRFLLE